MRLRYSCVFLLEIYESAAGREPCRVLLGGGVEENNLAGCISVGFQPILMRGKLHRNSALALVRPSQRCARRVQRVLMAIST